MKRIRLIIIAFVSVQVFLAGNATAEPELYRHKVYGGLGFRHGFVYNSPKSLDSSFLQNVDWSSLLQLGPAFHLGYQYKFVNCSQDRLFLSGDADFTIDNAVQTIKEQPHIYLDARLGIGLNVSKHELYVSLGFGAGFASKFEVNGSVFSTPTMGAYAAKISYHKRKVLGIDKLSMGVDVIAHMLAISNAAPKADVYSVDANIMVGVAYRFYTPSLGHAEVDNTNETKRFECLGKNKNLDHPHCEWVKSSNEDGGNCAETNQYKAAKFSCGTADTNCQSRVDTEFGYKGCLIL